MNVAAFTVVEHLPGSGSEFVGAEEGRLDSAAQSRTVVDAVCPAIDADSGDPLPSRLFELVIEARKPSTEPARSVGFVVSYEIGGSERELTVPLTLNLCPGANEGQNCSAT